MPNITIQNPDSLSKSSIDPTLRGDRVTSSGEELRDASGIESGFSKSKGCSQTRPSGTDDDSIVFMVL